MHEDRLVRILEEAKELYLRRPKQGQSFFGSIMSSFNKGVRKAMSRTSLLGSGTVSSISLRADGTAEAQKERQGTSRQLRRQQKAKGGADYQPKSLAKAIMSRDEDGYGVYTFEFESVDATEMLRNRTGSLHRKVQCQIILHRSAGSRTYQRSPSRLFVVSHWLRF